MKRQKYKSKTTKHAYHKLIGGLPNTEPNPQSEINVVASLETLSQHQKYIHELWQSNKTLTEIKELWHDYYQSLDDNNKTQVWQEFYAAVGQPNDLTLVQSRIDELTTNRLLRRENQNNDKQVIGGVDSAVSDNYPDGLKHDKEFSFNKVKKSAQKPKKPSRLRSLMFGVAVGLLAVLLVSFTFFNERLIAPLISPSRNVTDTPIIVDGLNGRSGDMSTKIIIPKINVEIPTIYSETSTDDKLVQKALEKGVLHYGTTANPGESGNVVIFGHSSNNIFNKGNYKFAFVLLSRLQNGDLFYLTRDEYTYAYKVFDKKIVSPAAVEVLGSNQRKNTATLITCDPPGTSLNRLVVVGEQISPDPNSNKMIQTNDNVTTPQKVPGNAPTLWDRFTNWL